MSTVERKGKLVQVAPHLYRYSATKRYYAVFKLNGKTVSKSLKTKDRELAQRRLKDILKEERHIDPATAATVLSAVLADYDRKLNGYALQTQRTRRSILKIFKATWKDGLDIRVRDINEADLELWLAQHRARLRKTTYNEYVRFLKDVFELALKKKAIAVSPAANFKELRRERPIRSTPTWEEFQNLVQNVRSQRFSAEAQDTGDLVEFMGLAGVGTAECANLLGNHIDFSANCINLYRKKTASCYRIPIFPQLRPLLEKLKQKGQIKNGQPVFRIRDPKKALNAACKRLNYPNFSSRALRRCFITRCVELGIDFKTISSWQGHTDGGALIAKTYSHLRNEHSEKMAEKLIA